MQTTRTPYSVSFMATVLLLFLFACHSTIANAAVALGATRVIYPANQKQVLLPVTNNDPASVYLIQSWIENAGVSIYLPLLRDARPHLVHIGSTFI